MSRRTNGTNRAGAMVNASRYTGYGKPKKKTASLAELNGHINKNINSLIISKRFGEDAMVKATIKGKGSRWSWRGT
ncbi:MAG: hypothetical protein ACLR8P_01780 [Clostridium fessum]